MIRYNTKEDKLEMSYEDICMTLHDCSDTLDCSTGYGGTYETIVDYIDKLQNNWNELKKFTKETIEKFEKNRCILSAFDKGAFATTKVIYHKMQELEQGKDENK